ncbi:MAG: DUF1015 family protein [Pseudomonadota bacterium]|nr:DUF1015 family protein [Pseudomonadota bacterium]
MSDIRPFRAVRAANAAAERVIAPPYDVMSEAEARALVAENPDSFVRVSRPEAVLPEGADSHAPEAYAAARREFDAMLRAGLLTRDDRDSYYLYGQKMGDHFQVGLVAAFSVHEYDTNLIKKHEFTRPDKERDRVAHIDATNCQTGMVFLAYRDQEPLNSLIVKGAQAAPEWRVTTEDDVEHTLWRVSDPALVDAITRAAAQLPAAYVADGHHRSAAASIVHRERAGLAGEHAWFLAGLFPASTLQILAYNRAVKDLFGHTPASLLAAVGAHFDICVAEPVPEGRGRMTMYLEGTWYGLTARDVPTDPVEALDVSLLQDRVLRPLLGIDNPRTDKRIDFIGGIRGWQELARLVDSGTHAVAFHLHPTSLEQLFAVADSGNVMPPKSTWFEPKLRDAVAMHALD